MTWEIECYLCNTGARGTYMCERHREEMAARAKRPDAAPPKEVPLELRPIDAGYHHRREKEAVKLAKAKENLEAALSSDAAPVANHLRAVGMCIDLALEQFENAAQRYSTQDGPDDPRRVAPLDDGENAEAFEALLDAKQNLHKARGESVSLKCAECCGDLTGTTPTAFCEQCAPVPVSEGADKASGGERPEQVGDAPVAKGNPRVVEHHILCRYPTIAEIGCKLCIACGHAVIRGNQYRHAHPEDAPGGPWKKEALSLLASVIHAARVAGPFDTSRSPFEKGLQNAKKKLLDALGLNHFKEETDG